MNVEEEVWVWVTAPKLGAAGGAAGGAADPPKPKPVELAPNAGLAGVPNVVPVVAAADPKLKEAWAGLGAGVDDAVLLPKLNGFGCAPDEPKFDCGAGGPKEDFPKGNVDWVGAVAVVGAALAMAKPPNEAVVEFWLGAGWPKANAFWLAAWGSGCVAPNVKPPLLEVVVAAAAAGAGAAAAVVVAVPNWNVLPVLGACIVAELVPKRDFTLGWVEGCVVVVMALLETVPMRGLVKPGKTDGAAVVLLVDTPNIEDVLIAETAETGLVVVRVAGCPKPVPAVAPPKMGLKLWTGGLLSGANVADADVVVVTAKMGLNPEASRGFVLLTDSELLTGALGLGVRAAVMGLEAVGAERVLLWLASPKSVDPITGGALLEDFMTWLRTWVKAEGCSTPAVEDWDGYAGGGLWESTAVVAFRLKPLGCTGVVDTDTTENVYN